MAKETNAMHPENCTLGIQNQTRIDNLERMAMEAKSAQNELWDAITDIRDRLLGRPSWTVVMLLTAMSSALVGMAIYILTH